MARGKIKYRDRSRQINDFSGLIRHRKITPTDIDGVIDYNGNAFIYLEGKYGDKTLDYGQQKALEHICDSHTKNGRSCYVIVFTHDIHNAGQDVPVHKCLVTKAYSYNRNWVPIKGLTVLDMIERLEDFMQNSEGIKI